MKKYTITCTPNHKDLPKNFNFNIVAENGIEIDDIRKEAEALIYAEWSITLDNDETIWDNIIYTYTAEDI